MRCVLCNCTLEVFHKRYVLYKFPFYLLTYLLNFIDHTAWHYDRLNMNYAHGKNTGKVEGRRAKERQRLKCLDSLSRPTYCKDAGRKQIGLKGLCFHRKINAARFSCKTVARWRSACLFIIGYVFMSDKT